MTREEREKEEELDAQNLSMVKTFAYHCKRCNYIWIPKDYEYGGPNDNPKTIAKVSLPRSCAKCKSKYRRQEKINREPFVLPPFINPFNKWA